MKNLFELILAAGIIISTSCEKQNMPDAPGKRLKMMKTTSPGNSSASFTNYRYDSKNRLIAQEDSGSNGILYKLYFEYDDQDHLLKTTINDTDESSGHIFQTNVRTYIYDGSGKIIESISTYPITAAAYVYKTLYTYDIKGRLIEEIQKVENVPELTAYTHYIYDDKGNLIEIDDYIHDNSLVQKRFLKYGRAINIYSQLGQFYFFSTNDMRVLSRNNVTEIVSVVGDPTTNSYFEYQFNSEGLPTNVKSGSDPNLTLYVNSEFFYE